MNRIAWHLMFVGAVTPLFLTTGCQSMSNTDKGVLTGAGVGSVAGALVGGQRGKAGPGALIGGAIGAVAGGLTGAAIDRSERKQAQATAQARALALQDVVDLTANGSSDAVIINQIRSSGSVFKLSAQEIIWLQNNGVREPVIAEMQATASRPVRPVYVLETVPPPPPPVGIGIGVGFHRRCW